MIRARDQLTESIAVKQRLLSDQETIDSIERASDILVVSISGGGKILFAGNGGSAADAQHLAGELVSRFYFDRDALGGLALTTDTSVLTAIGNDYGYEETFARQVRGLGRRGDVLVALTTSGNSPNILAAVTVAREMGLTTIALTGQSGGRIINLVDLCIRVPSDNTPRIQESHIVIGHILCAIVEDRCCPRSNR